MFHKDLIDFHAVREKKIHDAWINKKGVDIEVKPLATGSKKNYDPFNIEVRTLGYSDGRADTFNSKYESKAILINNEFQPISISIEQQEGVSDVDNHNEVYCFMMGELVPKYSEIKFKDFNTSFRVEEVQRKRPYSNVYKYLLVRD